MTDDETYVRRALELAREAAAAGNTPFGSLLVHDGRVLRESRNTTRTDADVTAHPELKLARWAASELDEVTRRETTMYTSTKPCMMCAAATYYARLGRVVYSVDGDTAADIAPGDDPVPTTTFLESEPTGRVEMVGPVLEAEGRAVHEECWNPE